LEPASRRDWPPHNIDGLPVSHCVSISLTGYYIGILPAAEGKIIGLSKYDRIVEYFASRFQIQEELVKQIGQYIMDMTSPRGLAVRISAVHMCKTQRGVRASHRSRMVNTYYWGELASDSALKGEFLQECATLDRAGP
jgi:GTP cyclohydrolase I